MRHLVFALLFLGATSVAASDDTQRLLDAPRVRDVLAVNVAADKAVKYRVDDRFGGDLSDNDTFAAPRSIELTYKNFNPFKFTVGATATSAPDPNQKDIGTFFEAFLGLAKGVAPATTAAGAGPSAIAAASAHGSPTTCLRKFEDCKKPLKNATDVQIALQGLKSATAELQKTEDDGVKKCALQLQECLDCGSYDDLLKDAAAMVGPVDLDVTTADLDRWKGQANGRNGIILARDEPVFGVKEKRKLVQNKIVAIQDFQTRFAAFMTVTDVCHTSIGSQTTLAAGQVSATEHLADNQTLLAGLDAIIKMLDFYADRNWRTGDQPGDQPASDLVIKSFASDQALQLMITVTFSPQQYTLDKASGKITNAPDTDLKRVFVLRRYRMLVPEVGVAGVYNDVHYPKYTAVAATAGGFTITKKTDAANVDAAITLNLLCDCIGGSFLYPGIQLGVSKSKDYPGILGGVVLRFAYPKQLSFAIGRMITWYKDIDETLTVGGPVASDADLQAHLKRRRAPTALYLAAQFNF